MKSVVPNEYRFNGGFFKSNESDGMKGMFVVPVKDQMMVVTVNVHPGDTEHIAVSNGANPVTDEQLEAVKRVFWEEDELDELFTFSAKSVLNPFVRHVQRKREWKTKIY